MGKSPGKWIKTVLFGKKSSKSSYPKGREKVANEREVLVQARASETDVNVAPPFTPQLNPYDTERDESKLELENKEAPNISHDDGISLPMSQDIDSQQSTLQHSPYDPEMLKQEQAATSVQAAFRGYLARRAFWALKGIIRLQALIRGHLVRRQAIATLCCMMGIVKLQAHVRGLMVRHSGCGLEVQKKCNQMILVESKLVVFLGVNMPARIGKLSANVFVCKLVASSPTVMPLHLHYDAGEPNSVWNWLERWSVSCFWKPVLQPKKASDYKLQKKQVNGQAAEMDTGRPKRSVRRIPPANLDGTSVQATFEFDKPKRILRKISSHPTDSVQENPQNELEKVKRNLRRVHNPVVENSLQPEVEFEKPKQSLEKVPTTTNLDIVEQSLNSSAEKMKKEIAMTVNSSAEKMKKETAMTINNSAEKMKKETAMTINNSAEKMKKETGMTVNNSAEKVKKETAMTVNSSSEKIRKETATVNSSAEKMAMTINGPAEKVKKETALTINSSAERMKKETTPLTNNSSAEKIRKETATVNSSAEKMKKEIALTINSSAEKIRKETATVNSSAEKMKKETALTINSSAEKMKKGTAMTVNSSAEKMRQEMTAVNSSTEKLKKETVLTVNSPAEKMMKEMALTVNGSAEKTKKPMTVVVSKSPDIETMPGPLGMNETSDLLNADVAAVDSKPSVDRTIKDENTPIKNVELNRKDDSANNENQKSGKKASNPAKQDRIENGPQNSPALPSYMAATESAKAKLRLQGSPRSGHDGGDKNTPTHRHSLPSSANNKISSQSPRTQRLVHSGKAGNKSDRSMLSSRDGTAKATQVEWKR